MPIIYVSGKFSATVLLQDKDYPYQDWIDKKLTKKRTENDKPISGIWLEIENAEDPVSPFTIPLTNLDVYEGGINSTQSEMNFTMIFEGKAKVNVHKLTKEALDKGGVALATAISINGAQQELAKAQKTDLQIQSKKL